MTRDAVPCVIPHMVSMGLKEHFSTATFDEALSKGRTDWLSQVREGTGKPKDTRSISSSKWEPEKMPKVL